ncbi:MAG: TRAP transporter small permease [Candidatus Accumulibacter sp.]|jgi:TRAP-type C4-dicarboxylate transport system permease small subunit|nr:TRAP transporter small permease [Accumulibacter sp.]
MSGKKISSHLYSAMKFFVAAQLMLMTVFIFYQIIMRYVFNDAPEWTEEISRYLFIWSSFFAAGMGVREHIHIGIDAAVNLLPPAARRVTQYMVALIILCLGAFLTWYGWKVVGITHTQMSPAAGISIGIVYAAAPCMGMLMVLFSALDIVELFRRRDGKRDGGDAAKEVQQSC